MRKGLRRARTLSGSTIEQAAAVLGNGSRISAQDTVPFALWAAARYHRDYPAAIRACVRAGGDMDTTAAITGGIVATQTGPEGIPSPWLLTRDPLPCGRTEQPFPYAPAHRRDHGKNVPIGGSRA